MPTQKPDENEENWFVAYISKRPALQLYTIGTRCQLKEIPHSRMIYSHSNQNHRTAIRSRLRTLCAAPISGE